MLSSNERLERKIREYEAIRQSEDREISEYEARHVFEIEAEKETLEAEKETLEAERSAWEAEREDVIERLQAEKERLEDLGYRF